MMILTALTTLALLQQPAQGFDHLKHKALFPSCTTCHAGAAQSGGGRTALAAGDILRELPRRNDPEGRHLDSTRHGAPLQPAVRSRRTRA